MNLSLSPPSKFSQFHAPAPSRNSFNHRSKLVTVSPIRKSSETSPQCYQNFHSLTPFYTSRSCSKVKAGGNDSEGHPTLQFQTHAVDDGGIISDSAHTRKLNLIDELLRFFKPYSMTATFNLGMAYMIRTLIENPHLFKLSLLPKAVTIVVAMTITAAFVAGINQIFDVEIDRINKPDLALAAGDLPIETAWLWLACCGAIGILASAWVNSKILIACVCINYLIGYVYSAPPTRFKNTSAGAMLSGMAGSICNGLGVVGATRFILGLPFQLSLPMSFFMTFATVFYGLFSIIKDLPDVEEDTRYGAKTLASIIGIKYTAFLGSGILLLGYVFAIIIALYNPQTFRGAVMIPAHIIFACCLIYQLWKLDRSDYSKEQCQAFYQSFLNFLQAEGIIFTFI